MITMCSAWNMALDENEQPSVAQNQRANTPPTGETPEQLKPYLWKAGDPSPNPSGRPKKRPISEIYERIMENPENVGLIEAAVLKTILAGKMAAQLTLKEMAERIEGKVTQPVDVNGELTLTLSDRIERARQKLNEP